MLGGPIWISQVFIPSQRQAILERFQQVEALGLGAVRIELKVANPVGIIYECYIMAEENYFSDQAVVSFRILYEKAWTAFLWMSLISRVAQVCLITSSY